MNNVFSLCAPALNNRDVYLSKLGAKGKSLAASWRAGYTATTRCLNPANPITHIRSCKSILSSPVLSELCSLWKDRQPVTVSSGTQRNSSVPQESTCRPTRRSRSTPLGVMQHRVKNNSTSSPPELVQFGGIYRYNALCLCKTLQRNSLFLSKSLYQRQLRWIPQLPELSLCRQPV